MKAIVAGGAASPPPVDEARRIFGAPYSIRYLTESGGIGGTALDADDDEALHSIADPGPVSKPRFAETGDSVNDGEIGELWLPVSCGDVRVLEHPGGTAETLVDGRLRR